MRLWDVWCVVHGEVGVWMGRTVMCARLWDVWCVVHGELGVWMGNTVLARTLTQMVASFYQSENLSGG